MTPSPLLSPSRRIRSPDDADIIEVEYWRNRGNHRRYREVGTGHSSYIIYSIHLYD